jgi:hypothetical protein
MTVLSPGEAGSSLRERRADISETPEFVCDAVLEQARMTPNVVQRGRTWRDHAIPDRWPEKVDRKIHPHIKPTGLITRLIGAVTQPGDLVVDPAAGSVVVMRAAHQLGRNFVGCDLRLPALTSVSL